MSAMPADARTGEMVQRAQQAMAAGRADEAARLWEQVLAAAPEHPQALLHLGQIALQKRISPPRARFWNVRQKPRPPIPSSRSICLTFSATRAMLPANLPR